MKVLSINGGAASKKAGAQIESIWLGDYDIGACTRCTGCEGCRNFWECIIKDDFAQVVEKIVEADGIVLASPTYWYSVTSETFPSLITAMI